MVRRVQNLPVIFFGHEFAQFQDVHFADRLYVDDEATYVNLVGLSIFFRVFVMTFNVVRLVITSRFFGQLDLLTVGINPDAVDLERHDPLVVHLCESFVGLFCELNENFLDLLLLSHDGPSSDVLNL